MHGMHGAPNRPGAVRSQEAGQSGTAERRQTEGGSGVETILTAVTQIATFSGSLGLTNATGFYFRNGQRLFLVTNRHVLRDEATGHRPDAVEILLHPDPANLAFNQRLWLPLYDPQGNPLWREARDSAGSVDVVTLPLDVRQFPRRCLYTAFTQGNLPSDLSQVEVGTSVRVVGFPLGVHDTLHVLPVMRHAIIASSFGFRFDGMGYFLTDSLLHRGASGSPVVMRLGGRSGRRQFPWMLLGVHSARLHANSRDPAEDERLNLFVAWYADVLLTLTA